MNKFDTSSDKIILAINYVLVTLLLITIIYPFWDILVLSFSSREYALKMVVLRFFNKNSNISAYKQILGNSEIIRSFLNSVVRVLLGTSVSVFLTALTAYPLSKKYLPYNKVFTLIIVFTMMFSGGLIPTYLTMKNLGLINSIWVLILPTAMIPYNVIIMRNFLRAIPDSLEESARIDGASNIVIWWKIILPLSKPVIATISLWVAVHHWNAYFDALIYITDRSKFVIQIILRRILLENQISAYTQNVLSAEQMAQMSTEDTVKAALVIVSTAPIIMVYPFIQKHFTKGIMLGAVKG